MPLQDAKPSASAASLALLVMVFCVGAFLPPFNGRTLDSVPLMVAFGVGICVSLALHLWYVGVAAQRLGRSAWRWVALALLTLPLGSIVAWIVFERALAAEDRAAASAGRPA